MLMSVSIYLCEASWVGELLVGFQDVAFLPSELLFLPHFLENCGRGESLGTTTCLKTVVGVSKGMLPVKYFRSNTASFYVG